MYSSHGVEASGREGQVDESEMLLLLVVNWPRLGGFIGNFCLVANFGLGKQKLPFHLKQIRAFH